MISHFLLQLHLMKIQYLEQLQLNMDSTILEKDDKFAIININNIKEKNHIYL